jgi:hypothetical protein
MAFITAASASAKSLFTASGYREFRSNPVGFVLVIDIKEYHAVVFDLMAESALFFVLFAFFPACFAPMVDEAVVAPTDVIFEPAMVLAMHPAVGVGRVIKEPIDDHKDALMPRRVVLLNLRHFGSEKLRGEIGK